MDDEKRDDTTDEGQPAPDESEQEDKGDFAAVPVAVGSGESPEGEKLGMIHLPEPVANLCFGGVKRNRLFITAGRSLFSIYVDAQGCPYGSA